MKIDNTLVLKLNSGRFAIALPDDNINRKNGEPWEVVLLKESLTTEPETPEEVAANYTTEKISISSTEFQIVAYD